MSARSSKTAVLPREGPLIDLVLLLGPGPFVLGALDGGEECGGVGPGLHGFVLDSEDLLSSFCGENSFDFLLILLILTEVLPREGGLGLPTRLCVVVSGSGANLAPRGDQRMWDTLRDLLVADPNYLEDYQKHTATG